MKFKITGNGDTHIVEIKNLLDVFIRVCKREYKKQIKGSKVIKASKYIQKVSPVPVSFTLPDEMMIAYYIEGNAVIMGIPMSLPFKRFQKRGAEKMKKNLEGYFKSKGCDVCVEVMKDE